MAAANYLLEVGSLLEKLRKEFQDANGPFISQALTELLGLNDEELQNGANALVAHLGCDTMEKTKAAAEVRVAAAEEKAAAAAASAEEQAAAAVAAAAEEKAATMIAAAEKKAAAAEKKAEAAEKKAAAAEKKAEAATQEVKAKVAHQWQVVDADGNEEPKSLTSNEAVEEENEAQEDGAEEEEAPVVPVQVPEEKKVDKKVPAVAQPEKKPAPAVETPKPSPVPQVPSPEKSSPQRLSVSSEAPGPSGGRLRLLETKQKNQHKLCKKKMKEIDELGAQIDSKKLKYKDLTDDQKDKLARRKELTDTIAELEALADELIRKEAEEEARRAEEELKQTPEWKAANAARLAEEARVAEEKAKRLAEEEARRAEEEARRLEEERLAALRTAEEEAAHQAAMEAKRIEDERLAAIKAAEEAAAEKEKQIKLRKTSTKKLKEIQQLEEKMASKGQTLADVLPEVQEKLSKKTQLEAQIAELDGILGPA